jgi:queuine tRNA-ribosyltransferase/7-cyano-7-deazaguanine tRNA-ribosyltransferase
MFSFEVIKKNKNSNARLGIIKTSHGSIETPNIAIVATKGSIRGLSFDDAFSFGAEIFMINTFHFFHNERYKIVSNFSGLHNFLNINYPLMTDSGGFQVFSLGFGMEHGVGKVANIFPGENEFSYQTKKGKNLVKIYEDGVEFSSPYDGKKLFLSPEISIKIQKILGADIIFSFDECTSPLAGYEYTKKALKRTHRWAKICLDEFDKNKNQALFGIVQGGEYEDLRKESALFINSLPFSGYGIGGSLGKTKKDIIKILKWVVPLLDENKPRHLLGIGEVDDIFNGVKEGIDTFDCVIPTRWARHNIAFTSKGRVNLRSSKYLRRKDPIDNLCKCDVCENFSAAYICHLLREKEMYGIILLTRHNVFWILNLFKDIRKAIKKGTKDFELLRKKVLRYW